MSSTRKRLLTRSVIAGEPVARSELAMLDATERAIVEAELRESPAGRRWLRADPDLTTDRADRLLEFESDFRQPRRDHTLTAVIERASPSALELHATAISTGAAATTLWQRLSKDSMRLTRHASQIVAGPDPTAATATLHLLVLDPLDPFDIGATRRSVIASRALASASAAVRGLAAEYLAEHDPAIILRGLDRLIIDDSERLRGIAWDAALRVDLPATVERATGFLGDEAVPVPHRRSALVSLGTHLPTSAMADILSYFVVHPDHDLAADAAELLHERHRNPITATAARDSPHADVREVAERLLDPQRGSPAAGGSRPGDPTRSSSDIYAEMLRQLEERPENQNDDSKR